MSSKWMGRMPTYGGILFILSLIYFIIIVLSVLGNTHLGITNYSEISQYVLPVIILDLIFTIPFFFLIFYKFEVPNVQELLMITVIIYIIAALLGFLFIHLNISMVIEEDPAEFVSYEGSEVFRYLDPFYGNDCEYGILPDEYLDGYDECLSLTGMALAVRYFIYLGPHNPITLFIGGYMIRRFLNMDSIFHS
jgi:hypothetical protein